MMTRGEDIVESCVDEISSSTFSEDVPSCVDANGVIRWLKPVREDKQKHFGGNFLFPPMYRFLFPP